MKRLEKIFEKDILDKRERVMRALNFQPLDRVPLHDQLSFNAEVIRDITGRQVSGYDYRYEDICEAIRLSLDACFPPVAPRGVERFTDEDGFVIQNDNWNVAIVSRPFSDVQGAKAYLGEKADQMRHTRYDAEQDRRRYHAEMRCLQQLIGETVIIDYPVGTGFCDCWSKLGLELFSYVYADDPALVTEFIMAVTESSLRRVEAIADPSLVPVALIAEDFASKGGPIFSPALLRQVHFPQVQRLTEAWQRKGLKVIYHSDGNWKAVIPDLIDCGVDGFYCLEPALGMDLLELRKTWQSHTWMGGIDGVDLMERGSPAQVREAVRLQILETGALEHGGVFIGTSSEVNPPIKAENYRAMVEAVGEVRNESFHGRDEQDRLDSERGQVG